MNSLQTHSYAVKWMLVVVMALIRAGVKPLYSDLAPSTLMMDRKHDLMPE